MGKVEGRAVPAKAAGGAGRHATGNVGAMADEMVEGMRALAKELILVPAVEVTQ